jgi:DNA-binding response OmpR family regulator
MRETVLIVEDDQSIRLGLEEVLSSEGYRPVSCDKGDEMVEAAIERASPALIVLDVMLPGRSGFEICKDLRKRGVSVPILMLTARGQELDKVVGLDAGADDYVTKPFGVRELVARIHALLRRSKMAGDSSLETDNFRVGEAEINPKTFEVSRNGASESLTPKELQLLQTFHRRRGEALSRKSHREKTLGVANS